MSADGIVTCDACPVLCRIRPGKTGACDRYGNVDGKLARLDGTPKQRLERLAKNAAAVAAGLLMEAVERRRR